MSSFTPKSCNNFKYLNGYNPHFNRIKSLIQMEFSLPVTSVSSKTLTMDILIGEQTL